MKRSFKNSFFIILILISLTVSGIRVTPAQAQTAMQVVFLPLPDGWSSGNLNGVWGSSASDVYAVGFGKNGSVDSPLLYRWNGSSWTSSTLPLPPAWTSGLLYGVWGSSASDVYVVGSGDSVNKPLLYHWNGSSWTNPTLNLPSGWRSGNLYGVWGSSASNVYAVGSGDNGSAIRPLLYHWNGTSWSNPTLNLPGGWESGNLYGVWGSSASNVYAVGSGDDGSTNLPLLYRWNGSSWSASSLSLPADREAGYLQGVWGTGASDIYAVGNGYDGSDNLPLLYHWNGSSWSATNPSLPADRNAGYLYGVWGSSTSDVYAVGSGSIGNVLAPLQYNGSGSSWTASSPPLPDEWSEGYLYGVWGSSADDVYAVGSGFNGNTIVPLLYHSTEGSVDPLVPGDVSGFTATTGTLSGSVDLSWTAPADDAGDNGSGPVASYLIKYSTSPFASWSGGTLVNSGVPAPAAPGTTQTMTVFGLNPGTLYYFAIRAQDEQYNRSNNFATANATSNSTGLPGKVTLITPSGTINSNQPVYTWNAYNGSSWYYLWVNGPNGNVIANWYTATQAGCGSGTGTCSVTPSTFLGGGAHTWWVQTWNDAGYGPWSDGKTFTTPTPTLPGKATLVSPTGSIGNNNPIYTWNQVSGATWYYLWVNGPLGNVTAKWYSSAQANCNGTTCSVVNATPDLGGGTHTWWVQTWNNLGYGPWSDGMTFTPPTPTVPGKATLVSPTGAIGTNNPAYTWNQVSGASWYYLWVDGPSGHAFHQWFSSAQANCDGAVCSVTPATSVSGGTHTWWVQTWNIAGYGPWSDGKVFIPPTPTLPGKATLNAPEGSISLASPTFDWNEISGATYYYVWVDGPSGNVFQKWYTTAEANCNGATCSVEPAITLTSGTYTWYIQTWNSVGYGLWSDGMTFTVSPAG